MDVTQILTAIDAEISRLQQARQAIAALESDSSVPAPSPRRGRPPKSAQPAANSGEPQKRKRNLSPEGRKRIQEAMKRRWAERNKSSNS